MSLDDGATVRSWIGDTGHVHSMRTWGERKPQKYVRFSGKLCHHPAWIVRPFVQQTGAER